MLIKNADKKSQYLTQASRNACINKNENSINQRQSNAQ